MNHGNKKGNWIKKATAEEIQNHIEKLEQEIGQYKEEMERRKQEVPLGVPLEDVMQAHIVGVYKYFFASESSKLVFDKWIEEYVKALKEITNGNPIDIKVLLPLLKKGWVAMDKDGDWFWYKNKPVKGTKIWNTEGYLVKYFSYFNIKPADDWKTSLMECGL